VAGAAQLCSCEEVSHGELGPVADDERLARVVTHPNHFRKDGSFKPGMFAISDIKGNKKDGGLSLMRADHMNEAELTRQAEAVAGCKVGETIRGIRICKARELRSVADSGGARSLCVKDDPVRDDLVLPDNPAHALSVGSLSHDDPEALRIQGVLVKLFGPLMSIADFFKSTRT
jgi:hypothetical protein